LDATQRSLASKLHYTIPLPPGTPGVTVFPARAASYFNVGNRDTTELRTGKDNDESGVIATIDCGAKLAGSLKAGVRLRQQFFAGLSFDS
jgi:hypothetical protein